MLNRHSKLMDFDVFAKEEKIGEIHDVYFRDSDWLVKYIIVESGDWLLGERFIVSTEAFGEPDWEKKQISAHVSKEQIENRPAIEFEEPVSQEKLAELHAHYQWSQFMPSEAPIYGPYPIVPPTADIAERKKLSEESQESPNLRSAQEVTGYEIECEDDCIGSVKDLFVDEEEWVVRYLLVDIGRWISGKDVIISPDWVSEIEWLEGEIEINLTKEQIENSPEYDPSGPLTREYEVALYDFYHQPGYWL